MVDPHPNSITKKELLKQAEQLGVVGRGRMTKAQLVEAIARQEAVQLAARQAREAVWKTAAEATQAATQEVRDALWTTVREEIKSATGQVQGSIRAAAQPAARQVRDTVLGVVQQEAESAARRIQSNVQAVVQQEARSAARQIQSNIQLVLQQEIESATPQIQRTVRAVVAKEMESGREALESAQSTEDEPEPEPSALQPLRAARHDPQPDWRRIGSAFGRYFVVPVIIAVITTILASNYVSSRILDRALLSSTDPVSTKLFFDRDNGVQGLTSVFHGRE